MTLDIINPKWPECKLIICLAPPRADGVALTIVQNIMKEKNKNSSNPIQLDDWTRYFDKLHNTKLTNDFDDDFQKKIIDTFHSNINSKNCVDILDKKFIVDELNKGIQSLKINKAHGLDSINNEMIKSGTEFFDSSYANYSTMCYTAKNTLHYGLMDILCQYIRKVLLTIPLAIEESQFQVPWVNVFTLLMNNRLQSLIEEHKLISNCQIGFRKGKRKINSNE